MITRITIDREGVASDWRWMAAVEYDEKDPRHGTYNATEPQEAGTPGAALSKALEFADGLVGK